MAEPPAVLPLGEKRFWDIIAAGCQPGADESEWYDALVEQLATLSAEELVAFDVYFDSCTDRLYTNDLWGAAYLINGGASDDGFYYFRCWLVGMGRKVFEAALANPDSLADIVDPDLTYEAEIYSVAWRAAEQIGLSETEYEALRERAQPSRNVELTGEDWDFDDDTEVRRRFPRLARKYLVEDEEA